MYGKTLQIIIQCFHVLSIFNLIRIGSILFVILCGFIAESQSTRIMLRWIVGGEPKYEPLIRCIVTGI